MLLVRSFKSVIKPVLPLLSATLFTSSAMAELQELPALGIELEKTSVSGLSSGAFMTSQFYMANSNIMVGAGVVAGGPYLCAQSNPYMTPLMNALNTCMHPHTQIQAPNTDRLLRKTKDLAKKGKIPDIDNVKDDRIYVFSGTADHVVESLVVDQTTEFFKGLGIAPNNIRYVNDVDAGHAMITDNSKDSKCNQTEPPYINYCGFEQSDDILKQIYGEINAPAKEPTGSLITFNQKNYVSDTRTSMSDAAFVYVPDQCFAKSCKLHVVFHGCQQGISAIGKEYVEETGYNQIADTNDLVILYPQVDASYMYPSNPQGCWDFWGYSGRDYYTPKAPQIKAVTAMVQRLAEQKVAINTNP